MRVELHPCMVLHQRPYRESSQLVEVFSSQFGRVPLIAKGIKQKRSGGYAPLRAFRPLDLAWTGRGELKTLVQAEVRDDDLALTEKRLFSGFYVNELLMRLLPREDSHPELYQVYVDTLIALQSGDVELALRVFEKRLLQTLGYGIAYAHEAGSETPIEAQQTYYVQADSGATRQPGDARVKVSGQTLLDLHHESLQSDATRREAKRLMRFLLDRQLGAGALHSRTLFTAV